MTLDVGFAKCGWAVYENGEPKQCGVIITNKSPKKQTRTSDDYAFRSGQFARQLEEIIKAYQCKALIGELPSGGAQSARAMVQMGMATAVVASVASLLSLPMEWASPRDVKIAVAGKPSATKNEMMKEVAERYGWPEVVKTNGRKMVKYEVNGEPLAACHFEHIADACGAYLALRDGNLVKLFG